MPHGDWFGEARYGMFIHWGPYSVAGRGEWVMNRERISPADYRRYAEAFTAADYDPARWADLAVAAGMKYVILTTRHHDGFALWDTRTTDFCATRLGPKRDLLVPYVEAVRAAGLKVGFYFSAADWSHPDYPGPHRRDWPSEWEDDAARRRFIAYYHAQLEELISHYGDIDILWYDGCIPQPLDGARINERVKELQPRVLINERNGEPFDFRCQEQSTKAKEGRWEACLTLNGNWGYHAGDSDWKSPRDVIRTLITTAAAGGNLLLNVGPRADGRIPEESGRILRSAGQWLARNREFLPNSGRSPFTWNNCSMPTVKDDRLYLHLLYWPGTEYCFTDLANEVRDARWLESGKPIAFEQDGPRLILKGLPETPPDAIASTVVLDLDGPAKTVAAQETFWIPE